jgi:preprotein translocase subunit SecB
MPVKNQSRLNFTGVDIHSVNVMIYNPYVNAEIKHIIIPKILLDNDKPDYFRIIMDVNIESEDFFKIDVSLSGQFILNMEAEDEHKKVFMHVNAPAILFPYVRSFISTLTANLGSSTGTITIPPQIFKGDIEIIDGENPVEDNSISTEIE